MNKELLKEVITLESSQQILAYIKDFYPDKEINKITEFKSNESDYYNINFNNQCCFKIDVYTGTNEIFLQARGSEKKIKLERLLRSQSYQIKLSSLKTKFNNFIAQAITFQEESDNVTDYNKAIENKINTIIDKYNSELAVNMINIDLPERYKFKVNGHSIWRKGDKINNIQIDFIKMERPSLKDWSTYSDAYLIIKITETNEIELYEMQLSNQGSALRHGIPYLDTEHLKQYQDDLDNSKELSLKLYSAFNWIQRNWEGRKL